MLTAGLGGMGGAQPLAVTMNGGVAICVEVDPTRIERRLANPLPRHCRRQPGRGARAGGRGDRSEREPLSIGLLGNAAAIYPEMVRRGRVPDMVTDQTSAHDPLRRLHARSARRAAGGRAAQARPRRVCAAGRWRAWPSTCAACSICSSMGAIIFDYGNNIRQQAYGQGVTDAFDFPGFVPAYIRPLFCEGKGPFRWAALSGDPADIYKIDDMVLREFADNESVVRWIKLAREQVPSRACPRASAGWATASGRTSGSVVNAMVRSGELSAPIVIGRDHLDTG